MSVAQYDLQHVTFRYEPWGRDVTMRPLSAAELIGLQADMDDDAPDDRSIAWYAQLLSMCVVAPSASAEEWPRQARFSTLIDLGQRAMEISGIGPAAAKKNLPGPCTDSPSNSAETLE